MAYVETGTEALAGNLRAMGAWMLRDGAMRAVRAGGKVVLAAEVERAPVQENRNLGSDSLEEGELKENLKLRTAYAEGVATAYIGPSGKGGKIARAAHLVEYGHRIVTGGKSTLTAAGTRAGGGRVHTEDVPAYPFLRPAVEASEGAALDAIAAQLNEDLGKGAR